MRIIRALTATVRSFIAAIPAFCRDREECILSMLNTWRQNPLRQLQHWHWQIWFYALSGARILTAMHLIATWFDSHQIFALIAAAICYDVLRGAENLRIYKRGLGALGRLDASHQNIMNIHRDNNRTREVLAVNGTDDEDQHQE